jgi:flagellar biosynthesis/type III secretory pathway protein FliH
MNNAIEHRTRITHYITIKNEQQQSNGITRIREKEEEKGTEKGKDEGEEEAKG